MGVPGLAILSDALLSGRKMLGVQLALTVSRIPPPPRGSLWWCLWPASLSHVWDVCSTHLKDVALAWSFRNDLPMRHTYISTFMRTSSPHSDSNPMSRFQIVPRCLHEVRWCLGSLRVGLGVAGERGLARVLLPRLRVFRAVVCPQLLLPWHGGVCVWWNRYGAHRVRGSRSWRPS